MFWNNSVKNYNPYANDPFPLHSAASVGDVRAVLFLLTNSSRSDSIKAKIEKALDKAELLEDIFKIREKLAGEDKETLEPLTPFIINDSNNQNKTALHLAAERGHVNVIKILIAANADIGRVKYEKTPLSLAIDNNKQDAAALLLAVEAHINTNDKEDRLKYVSGQPYGGLARQLLLDQLMDYSPLFNQAVYKY